jgi:sulfate adenylyltransferase subunit 2
MSEEKQLDIFPQELEDEAIYIIREVAAQFEKPALLFSGGKDSITLVQLARKAFYPAKVPFPMLHIDTGHNFQETIDFRDWLAKESGMQLIVRYVQDSIDQGKVKEETGKYASRKMKKRQERKKEFFLYVMISGNGMQKSKGRSCLIC